MEKVVEKTSSRDDKIAALQQVLAGQQCIITEVAAKRGISRFLLWSWAREYSDEARRTFPPHMPMGRREIRDRCRRRVQELKRENDLLKRSLAILAGASEADYCL